MVGFQLWREFKLSIAEILAVFPEWKIIFFDKEILIIKFVKISDIKINEMILSKINHLWWTIKIFKIYETIENNSISDSVWKTILNIGEKHEWKFQYWISVFWEKLNLKSVLINTKKLLKNNLVSSRFINKDFKNLSSSQIIWEKLIIKNTDFNIISTPGKIFFWTSIWVQDIVNYSKRDWQKNRDMNVWMLPPKLAQIMINLSGGNLIYDPFVWLGTILIESVLMWNTEVFWSDLSDRMVEISTNNIDSLNEKNIKINIFKQNAKYISEIDILNTNNIDSIVTEWYLGEIMMTHKNISPERIEKQKISLLDLYEWFFSWLTKLQFKWNIVISFPFWEIRWKYFYFSEIYDTITKYCNIQKLFPIGFELNETKSWSLFYKRDKQLVGREIFCLKIK